MDFNIASFHRLPNVVSSLCSWYSGLTDRHGLDLAKLVVLSNTIEKLYLADNLFGDETYLAMAAALRTNTSLQLLTLCDNKPTDRLRIDRAFAKILECNPRKLPLFLCLYTRRMDDYHRLTRCPRHARATRAGASIGKIKKMEAAMLSFLRPNRFCALYQERRELTDAISANLVKFIKECASIREIYLADNLFGDETYLSVAAALCVNTSLRILFPRRQ